MKLSRIITKISGKLIFVLYIVSFVSCNNLNLNNNQFANNEYVSVVSRNDSLIVNEFYLNTKDDNSYKSSHLYTLNSNKKYFLNKSPFLSFFNSEIIKLEISLFESNGIDIDSLTYTFSSISDNNISLVDTIDNVKEICKEEVNSIFRNVVLSASDTIDIGRFNIDQRTIVFLDSVLNQDVGLDLSANDIIEYLSKHPENLKNRAFTNFVRIKMWDKNGNLITINDCSEELPTGLIWIFKMDNDYLQCYDTRIMDFVRTHISQDHIYTKYLSLEWMLYLQYMSSTY